MPTRVAEGFMNEVWKAIVDEFIDLPSAAALTRVAVRLVLAAILGGVLGYEREKKGKQAGMRTHMMIAVGAAMFALVPQQAGMSEDAVARVLQGLVAGIGFLGAGPILKLEERMEVRGLTTAASIWLTAAMGMAVGLGRGATAVVATGLALLILSVLPKPEPNGPKEPPYGDRKEGQVTAAAGEVAVTNPVQPTAGAGKKE
jgi:putative Mg2+ transporter-C (MgtC) family protein